MSSLVLVEFRRRIEASIESVQRKEIDGRAEVHAWLGYIPSSSATGAG